MDVYAFANQKGGVGKTTVTLGIAAALARTGVRTLVVELDPQASASRVGEVDTTDQVTVADAMLEPARFALGDAIVETTWGFALAPAETALASREARRSTADEFVLRDQLARVDDYDVTLIDCPPSLGVLTLNALAAADRLVVVTEPTFLALQGTEELLRTRELVGAHYNPRLELAGVIVSRVERTVEHREPGRDRGVLRAGPRMVAAHRQAHGAPGGGEARGLARRHPHDRCAGSRDEVRRACRADRGAACRRVSAGLRSAAVRWVDRTRPSQGRWARDGSTWRPAYRVVARA